MGRPLLYNKHLLLKVTDALHARVRAYAEAHNMPVTDAIRELVGIGLGSVRRETPTKRPLDSKQ